MIVVSSTATPRFRNSDRESTGPISLVLIDDNRLVREGIAAMIRTQADFRVLASSADVDEALEFAGAARPDVVLLDFALADRNSLPLTETVRLELPSVRVIVMGLLPTQEDVVDYIRAGVAGFIMKDASFEEFFETIRQVASGHRVLPRALTASLFDQIIVDHDETAVPRRRMAMHAAQVTAREREVIDALSEGLSNKEIAARLNIAVHTVKSHVHNVLEKLALRSRLEVAAFSHAALRESSAVRR